MARLDADPNGGADGSSFGKSTLAMEQRLTNKQVLPVLILTQVVAVVLLNNFCIPQTLQHSLRPTSSRELSSTSIDLHMLTSIDMQPEVQSTFGTLLLRLQMPH